MTLVRAIRTVLVAIAIIVKRYTCVISFTLKLNIVANSIFDFYIVQIYCVFIVVGGGREINTIIVGHGLIIADRRIQ